MFPQRYSCDRCRQQKVRCLKNWDLLSAVGGGNHLTPCERCTKADVPCVYSLRQRNRRSKGEDIPSSPRGNPHVSQDISNVLSSRDIPGYDFNGLMIPSLDTTMTCIDDGDGYSWNHNPDLTCNKVNDDGFHVGSETSPIISRDEGKETLTGQLMKLSNRAIGATQEIECAVVATPLTVNSPAVNEAFEAANALVRIINSIPSADSTLGSSEILPRERQLPTEYSLIFLALASHQHVLSLFRAICDSIKKSLGSMIRETESQQQTLHGDGSSSAQFIMVLQLVMHLLNRIGRSLRMRSRRDSDSMLTFEHQEEGEEHSSLNGIVDSAHLMLRILPDEHIKLSEIIQELQVCIEEGFQI